MHGHVIAHGDDLSAGIEDGAGIIAAFLDVGRKGGAAQGDSHFFGDGVVEILEDLEFDRIGEFDRITEFGGTAHVRDEFTTSWRM